MWLKIYVPCIHLQTFCSNIARLGSCVIILERYLFGVYSLTILGLHGHCTRFIVDLTLSTPFAGSIPPEIGNLYTLTLLQLFDNELSGERWILNCKTPCFWCRVVWFRTHLLLAAKICYDDCAFNLYIVKQCSPPPQTWLGNRFLEKRDIYHRTPSTSILWWWFLTLCLQCESEMTQL